MNNKPISRITFVFADNTTFNLVGDETARDAIQKLKEIIDNKGCPVKTSTGLKIIVSNQ